MPPITGLPFLQVLAIVMAVALGGLITGLATKIVELRGIQSGKQIDDSLAYRKDLFLYAQELSKDNRELRKELDERRDEADKWQEREARCHRELSELTARLRELEGE